MFKKCAHDVLYLQPVAQWEDLPLWRCGQCRSPRTGCEHPRQYRDGAHWRCLDCQRALVSLVGAAA